MTVSGADGGTLAITIERFDPLAGWQFLRRIFAGAALGHRSAARFTPPAVGRYRLSAEYRGSRGAAPSASGFDRILVAGPLRRWRAASLLARLRELRAQEARPTSGPVISARCVDEHVRATASRGSGSSARRARDRALDRLARRSSGPAAELATAGPSRRRPGVASRDGGR